jgi:hypothetical protein
MRDSRSTLVQAQQKRVWDCQTSWKSNFEIDYCRVDVALFSTARFGSWTALAKWLFSLQLDLVRYGVGEVAWCLKMQIRRDTNGV